MFNKQLKSNIKEIDVEINKLIVEMKDIEDEDERNAIETRIDKLSIIRQKMSEDLVNESYSKEILAGAVSLGAIVLVLKHEKSEIITTKAFSMATKLFRG